MSKELNKDRQQCRVRESAKYSIKEISWSKRCLIIDLNNNHTFDPKVVQSEFFNFMVANLAKTFTDVCTTGDCQSSETRGKHIL